MGCNCKRVNKFADNNGMPQYEGFGTKVLKNLLKVALFLIAVVLAVVITPILIFVVIYKLAFGKDNSITLPKFMRKYLE